MTEKKVIKIESIKPIRPRALAFKSLKEMYVQLIDKDGKVLAASSSKSIETKATPIEIAGLVGEDFAKKLKSIKVSEIVFDRNGNRYHGRIKALADGIRKGGIKF